jgi:wyosine [tRNA(Phe)-imidazoG37] synthetase (radical SAM superfamily)
MGIIKIDSKHDFVAKLRQPSILPRVLNYIKWQKAVRKARNENKISPEIPKWLVPLSINFDLTTACNYYCDHCVDLDILNSPVKYVHERLMASLGHMIKLGLRSVIIIGGGEPTLYPKFGDIVRYLKEHGIQIAIVSNGSRNQTIYDIADCLSEKDWVRLSLDSGTNDTFVRMHKPRKEITLEEICSWVPRIRSRNSRLPIGFSFIISVSSNIDEIVTATKLARNYRFSYISFKPLLTRYPSGAEVMDPSVVTDFKFTIERIRIAVDEAKTYETEGFRIIESTNLRALKQNTWRDFTHQPSTCHMQAFHQILSPLGLFNCPGYRGVENARIAGKDAYSGPDEIRLTQESVANILNRFDARKECADVTCLYNSANWWIEKALNGELEPADLEVLPEHFDYFF